MNRILSLFLVMLCVSLFAVEWDFSQGRLDWKDSRLLEVTETPEGLLLEPSGKYANLAAYNTSFSPKDCDVMQITYTATGLSSNVGGQLFFGTDADGTLDEEKKFYVPPITWGGEECELFVDLKSQGKLKSWSVWQNATAITKLRLDLVNEYEPGVKVLFKRIRFLSRSEYLNEKYGDLVAQGIPLQMDVYLPNAEKKEKDDSLPLFVSKMCAPDKSFMFVGLCNMRIPFVLDDKVEKALWQSVCDDQVEAVWLNGRLIDRKWSIDWATPDAFEISPDYFVKGENILAVTYRNTGSEGGIMLDLQILQKDGAFFVVTPEKGVGYTGRAPDGWMYPETDCDWGKVFTRPGPPAAPWVNFHPNYRTIVPDSGRVSVRVLSAKSTSVTVVFSSEAPLKENDVFYARLYGANEKLIMNFNGTAEELKAKKNADGGLEVSFQAYGGKYYGSATDVRWEFGMVGQNVIGDNSYVDHIDDTPLPGEKVALTLAQTPSGPTPMLDGKPFFFNILTAHNYADFIFETGMEGHDSPFNVIAVRLGGRGETDWWLGPDKYDFSGVDRTLSLMLERYPDSYLGPYIWCHPGYWYRKTYPERLSRMEDGSEYNYYVAAVTFAHPDVRRDAEKAVAALVRHLREFFGSRVLLVNLMGGISCEWQGWAAHSDQYADFSDFSKQDFREYAAKAGIQDAEIPRRPEREKSFDGVLRNPAEDAVSVLYDKYYSESVAGMIAGIAATAKRASDGEILVGCYYGYLMEYGNLSHCVNGGGHNDLKTLLASPNVDFFLSPQSYGIRSFGAPNAEMKPYGAIRLAGKLSMLEDDTRTHLTFKTDYEQTLNPKLTLDILKRNVGMSLSRRTELNQLPLISGGDLNDPAVRAMFNRTLLAGQYLMEHGKDPTPEIAAVIDEEAIGYFAATTKHYSVPENRLFKYNHDGEIQSATRYIQPVSGDLVYYQRIPLGQFGAPVDVVLLDDVIAYPDRYKMVIFLNAVKDKPELRQAIQGLRERGKTVVFTYGTGFLGEEGLDIDAISTCTGMNIAKAQPGEAIVEFNNGAKAGRKYPLQTRFCVADNEAETLAFYPDTHEIAVAGKNGSYFYGAPELDQNFLREVAKRAGAHIYIETNDNLYASSDVVSIHAASAGRKTIALPETADVVDIYSREVVARGVDSFEIDMKAFDTRVFLIGNADEILKSLK